MKRIIVENKWFLLPWLLWIIALSVYVAMMPKGATTLWINERHTPILDFIFKWLTWLGDGLTVGIICILLLFVQYRAALFATVVSVVNLILTGVLKQYFDVPRPATFFDNIDLHFVEGVRTYYHLSFPSGHTSAAFCIYLSLAIIAKNKYLGLLFFVIAIGVAHSRVYLLQHFEEDLIFGAALAVAETVIIASLLYSKPLREGSVWNRSLINRRKASLKNNAV